MPGQHKRQFILFSPNQGLKTQEAVSRKWSRDFATCRQDQVEKLDEDTGLPTGKLVWRIWVPVHLKHKTQHYQDSGAHLEVGAREKALPSTVASFKTQFTEALHESLTTGDIDFSSLGVEDSATPSSLVRASSRPKMSSSSRRGPPNALVISNSTEATSIDKLLAKVNCVITAASKVRKATLREFNTAEDRLQKALQTCFNLTGKVPGDISEEEPSAVFSRFACFNLAASLVGCSFCAGVLSCGHCPPNYLQAPSDRVPYGY